MLFFIALGLTCVTLLPVGYFFARHQVASWHAWRAVLRQCVQRGAWLAMMVVAILVGCFWLSDRPPESLRVEALADPRLATSPTSLVMERASLLPAAAWRPIDPLKLRMYAMEETDFWFRIPVPATAGPVSYTAEIHYAILGLVEFALVSDGHIVDRATFGSDNAVGSHQWAPLFPMLSFYSRPGTSQTVYVHASGSGAVIIPLTVQRAAAFEQHRLQSNILLGLLMGCLVGLLLYNLSLSITLGDRTYLLYAGYQGVLLAFLMVYNGLLPNLSSVIARDRGMLTTTILELVYLAIVAFVPFYMRLFDVRRRFPWLSKSLKHVVTASLVALFLTPFEDCATKFLALVLILFGSYVVAATSLFMRLNQDRVFYFSVGFVGFLACIVMHIMSLVNLIPSNTVAEQILGIGCLWDGLFTSIALSRHISMLRLQRTSVLRFLGAKASNSLAANDDPVHDESATRHMHVAIMFLDIASFSVMTEKFGSVAVYHSLSRQLTAIRKIIAAHGGTVDRSLGDGLISVFTVKNGMIPSAYVQNAFQAAIAIQRMTVKMSGDPATNNEFVMPIRIGLHTTEVLVGNLGEGERVDFGMIGTGVHQTQLLEGACSPFSIIASEEFCKIMATLGDSEQGFHEIHIARDMQEQLFKAFEFDPFRDEPETRRRMELAFEIFLGHAPTEPRQGLEVATSVRLRSHLGEFRVIDYSLGGFGVVGDAFIGRKAVLSVQIDTSDEYAARALRDHHLDIIKVEVRWCRAGPASYAHGLRIVGLNTEQKETILALLGRSKDAALGSAAAPAGDGGPYAPRSA